MYKYPCTFHSFVVQLKLEVNEMDNKTEKVQVRVTPGERDALVAMARKELIKPSEMLRFVLREAAQRRGLWPPAEAAQTGREVTAR